MSNNYKKLSTNAFMKHLTQEFQSDKPLYNKLIIVMFKDFDLDEIVKWVIQKDNIDLLEDILGYDVDIKLDESFINLTAKNCRVTMAKAIYEFIHPDKKDEYLTICYLIERLHDYDVNYNQHEDSIDTLLLSIRYDKSEISQRIIRQIRCDFWDNFLIKYVFFISNLTSRYVIDDLLSDNNVDPGVIDCKSYNNLRYHDYTTKFLRHPLVSIDTVDETLILENICHNNLGANERIFRTGNDRIQKILRCDDVASELIHWCNDITCLAIKMGIIDISQIPSNKVKPVKKYLKDYVFDEVYVMKPYHLNLDPDQIFEQALQTNDLELAKSIKHYVISINEICIAWLYNDYYESIDKKFRRFIMKKMKEYDPNALISQTKHQEYVGDDDFVGDVFDDILSVVVDNELFDFELAYDDCKTNPYAESKLRELIRTAYTDKEYKDFCIRYDID